MRLAGSKLDPSWELGGGESARPRGTREKAVPARGWCSIGQLKLRFQRPAALYLEVGRSTILNCSDEIGSGYLSLQPDHRHAPGFARDGS